MRVLVCGSRTWEDEKRLFGILDSHVEFVGEIDVLIHGDAPGAEALAGQWAAENGYQEEAVGEGDPPHLVIAFWDGRSTGTLEAIQRAVQSGIRVRIYSQWEEIDEFDYGTAFCL